jgi:hypothetical protein
MRLDPRRRVRRLPALAVALLALAVVPSCVSPTDEGPPTAVITLVISPVSVSAVCPDPFSTTCVATIDATVTLAENAGLGAHVDGFDVVVKNPASGQIESTTSLGPDWVRTQVGTDRLEPLGKLSLRPIVSGFPITRGNQRASRLVLITAHVTDDKGHALTQTAGVEIVPS